VTASTIILRACPHRITAVLANYHAIGGEQLLTACLIWATFPTAGTVSVASDGPNSSMVLVV
jgi:hypothetical protein